MTARQLKPWYFTLEWLNAYSTGYYSQLIYFYTASVFGFSNLQNLMVSAGYGLVYIGASMGSGKLAQRHGYFKALRLGFGLMLVSLLLGLFWRDLVSQMCVLAFWTVGVCFTWPSLEALVSEGENRHGVARNVGIYNIMWSSGSAMSFFTGGALLEHLGMNSLFYLPAIIHAIQLVLLICLQGSFDRAHAAGVVLEEADGKGSDEAGEDKAESDALPAGTGSAFLKMAWLSNPFAYVAINTLTPLLPDVANRLALTTTMAGVVGSVWMFARFGAFVWLWRWRGWHYHYGWLAGSYLVMLFSFALIVLAPQLAVVLIAEILFGLTIGLIYYSSLFYSMDVGETKGEHGGFHEALIGLGIFLGPASGAISLKLIPREPNAGIWAVNGLLLVGFLLLCTLRKRR